VSSEHERIAEITRRLQSGGVPTTLRVGIGDDAAVLRASARDLVLSVDASVEGVHFERAWLAPEDIGFRALSAALSDLAAMAAEPRCALVALTCPAELDDATLYAIVDGFAQGQAHYGCPIAGGNLAAGPALSITTTVVGESPERPLLRSGARAGHGLYVTGTLGAAAIGLQLLRTHREHLGPEQVARFRRPTARIEEGRAIAAYASACIDVSDGLLQDLGHVCAASGVGCDVELACLPLPAGSPLTREETLELALRGGEDYELLVAAEAVPSSSPLVRIGTFTTELGIRTLDSTGSPTAHAQLAGFDHFRPKSTP